MYRLHKMYDQLELKVWNKYQFFTWIFPMDDIVDRWELYYNNGILWLN